MAIFRRGNVVCKVRTSEKERTGFRQIKRICRQKDHAKGLCGVDLTLLCYAVLFLKSVI